MTRKESYGCQPIARAVVNDETGQRVNIRNRMTQLRVRCYSLERFDADFSKQKHTINVSQMTFRINCYQIDIRFFCYQKYHKKQIKIILNLILLKSFKIIKNESIKQNICSLHLF